jgi:signal transduction histidine kinase
LLWQPPSAWPRWIALLWLPSLLVVVFPASIAQAVGTVGLVAGSLAALLTWNAELHDRALAAQREVTRLADESDPVALALADQFAGDIAAAPPPTGAADLYVLWRRSLLASQGYPVRLALWDSVRGWQAELALDSLSVDRGVLDSLLQAGHRSAILPLRAPPGLHHLVIAPSGAMSVVALVGPATGLVPPGRLGRLLEPDATTSMPYRLVLRPADPAAMPVGAFRWQRDEWQALGRYAAARSDSTTSVQVQLPLGTPGSLLLRGAVLLVLDMLLLAVAWSIMRYLETGAVPGWIAATVRNSFRGRLALTLAAFFVVPALALAAWGFGQLRGEPRRMADALVRHRMADALHASGGLGALGGDSIRDVLRELGDRVDTHLGYYEGGRLRATTAGVLSELGVLPPLMDDDAFVRLALRGGLDVIRDGPALVPAERIGYRLVAPGTPSHIGVLALPSRVGEFPSTPRDDLALLLLLSLAGGFAAAFLAARVAAGTLAQPVAALQRAAVALGAGAGDADPGDGPPPTEFAPVFSAFRQMAADVRAGREALESARRRTERVLAAVPAGVVALDDAGRIVLANAEAEAMLGASLSGGASFVAALSPAWRPLAAAAADVLAGRAAASEAPLEVTDGPRRVSVQLAPMGGEIGGVVIAMADVTELSRAQRVLAWGEMARQVAHEIKNPLTPMRLGVQHLRRAWRDGRDDYAAALDETTQRILGEIDRLDTVARAFSRFGAPAPADAPLEVVDLAGAARDVAQLYALAGGEGATIRVAGAGAAPVYARRDEVKEVLVNLLENARQAGAGTVTIEVRADGVAVVDDGNGIAPESLHRVFEPHFSTTSSGAGLGLSIVRRLVDSWGGEIRLESEPGRGTTVTVTCRQSS